jgi:retinol dehydrogenase-12
MKEGHIIASTMNPGFVATDIMREANWYRRIWFSIMKSLLARTAEVGGRTLVNAAEGGDATHGAYLNDCKPTE